MSSDFGDMSTNIFRIAIILTLALFLVPKKIQYYIAFVLYLSISTVSSLWAVDVLFAHSLVIEQSFIPFLGNELLLVIDKLSAFFILVVNFTVLTGLVFAKGYLQPYLSNKSKSEMALHFFSFIWLYISMLLVVMIQNVLAFLIIWEVMSISSLFLVIFESDKKETIKVGLQYLIQMHIGVVFLMFAFILSGSSSLNYNFADISNYFNSHNPLTVFLLFFIGFGIKAGFVPFHTWLPNSHPTAPSHVSGVMSGVMIKMGIYGILRVLLEIHSDLFYIGLFILVVSLTSGLVGVSFAIVQHDIKKLLAYHSIENIGIIGIGIGLGVIGLAKDMPVLAALGFCGAILHVLNHSLFKSLLFYTAGAVYKQTHTKNIEQLGGLIKKMPKTAILFLLGALSISGLPPFNGFISEFLIYSGMFKSMQEGGLFMNIILLFSIVALAMIGGLAIFCFTKAFSVIFLGSPRTKHAQQVREVGAAMIFPNYMIGFMIVLIGFLPVIFVRPIASIVTEFAGDVGAIEKIIPTLKMVSMTFGIFVVLIVAIWIVRLYCQRGKLVKTDLTWGCGYTGANPALHQYTATSYADNFRELSAKVVNVTKEFDEFGELEIFPKEREFKTHSTDLVEDKTSYVTGKLLLCLEKMAVFQTGKIQHYLLYALLFISVISLLSYLNWI